MSATWVVQEEPTGLWVMGCTDQLHGMEPVFTDHRTKAAAERAATKHRRHDRALRSEISRRDRQALGLNFCPNCGCRCATQRKPLT